MNRAEQLAKMKAAHRKRVAQIRADQDLTNEAKRRREAEEAEKHHAALRAEEERIEASIRSDVEAAYRAANGPGPVLDAAAELRLARLREEVRDELDTKRLDPIRGYEEAVRAGDKERASAIAKIGPRYLEGFRRARLAELVEQNMPERDRRARQRLAELEREAGSRSRPRDTAPRPSMTLSPMVRWERDNRKARGRAAMPLFSAPTPSSRGEGAR